MTRYKQRLPDPFVKGVRDMGIVRFGHLNALADRVTNLEDGSSDVQFLGIDGTVSLPGIAIGGTDTGLYKVSATQTGFSQDGALVLVLNSAGIATSTVAEQVTGAGIVIAQNTINKKSLTALNTTGNLTAAMVNKGGITSTSAATVTATLATATAIGSQIGAVNGTSIEFIVDNTAGANVVTVAVNTGITVCSGVVTGSDTLTVSVANAIGIFRLVFSSATVAKLYRIG